MLGSRVAAQPKDLEGRIEKEVTMRNEIEMMAQGKGKADTGKCVYLVSDDSGETAQLLLSRLLVQYSDLEPPSVRLFAELDSVSKVREVVVQAQSSQQDVFVLATFLQPALSDALGEFGDEMKVRTYNVMAGLQRMVAQSSSSSAMEQLIFDGSSDELSLESSTNGDGPVKKMPTVNSAFFQMAEAVQFAQQHISGVNSQEWPDADVLLVGPSRVGKETLAYFLAQRGIKAACFTASSAGKVPPALSSLDPSKVVFLTMSVDFLMKRREYRVQELKRKGVPVFFDAGYTNRECIELELDSILQLARKQLGWIGPIDITDYDIPEACDMVLIALKHASIKD
jgi:regulator of PEP synthase PpsR (kinase-PPPase family)